MVKISNVTSTHLWTHSHRQKSEVMEFVFGVMLTVKKTKKTITMSVAAGEEGGKLAVDDHWEVEHRAHEASRTRMLARAMLPLTPNMAP